MKFSITDAINTTFWIAWNRVTNNFNDCYKTCRDLKVIVGGRNMKKVVLSWIKKCNDYIARHVSSFQLTNSKGLFYLYYEKRIVRSKEHYFYTGVSLFAEIGGYLGLLLGISFLNFASWFSELIKSRISSRKTYNHHTANMQSQKWSSDKTGEMTPVE